MNNTCNNRNSLVKLVLLVISTAAARAMLLLFHVLFRFGFLVVVDPGDRNFGTQSGFVPDVLEVFGGRFQLSDQVVLQVARRTVAPVRHPMRVESNA